MPKIDIRQVRAAAHEVRAEAKVALANGTALSPEQLRASFEAAKARVEEKSRSEKKVARGRPRPVR